MHKSILRVYFVNLLNRMERHSNDVSFHLNENCIFFLVFIHSVAIEIIHFGLIEIGLNIDINSNCSSIYLC